MTEIKTKIKTQQPRVYKITIKEECKKSGGDWRVVWTGLDGLKFPF